VKRPNASGSIEVLPDGRARIRAVIDGKRRQVGPVYANREKALAMLAAWNAERDNGVIESPTEAAAATLGAAGSAWIDVREVAGSRSRAVVKSVAAERSIWRQHVEPSALGKLAVGAIRTRDVEAFAVWLRGRKAVHAITTGPVGARKVKITRTARPISKSMQTHALRLVRAFLDDAVRREVIPRNPATGVRVALGGPSAKDLSDDWLRAGEIAALLGCEEIAIRDRTAYAAAIGLALRLNDLKSIELAHLHLDSEVPGPHVVVRIAKADGKLHRVPILPWLAPWLRAHVATLPEGSRYLFPNPDGERYAKFYDFGWAAKLASGRPRVPSALERAGVARRIRFHDLRGTTATMLSLGAWGRTWSLHEIQSMLAHSDQRVTERYVRRALDSLSDAARATPGCPGLPWHGNAASTSTPRNLSTLPAGFEPATSRLGSDCSIQLSYGSEGDGIARNARPAQQAGVKIRTESRSRSRVCSASVSITTVGTPKPSVATLSPAFGQGCEGSAGPVSSRNAVT
jgi:integrase